MNTKIVVFYLNNNKDYCLNIYNSNNLDKITEYIYIDNGPYIEKQGIFFKGLHLKDGKMALIYYKSKYSNSLCLKIGFITNENTNFNVLFSENLDQNNFIIFELINDFIKINDERLAFIGVKYNDAFNFNILLFDLYDNYKYMKIRKYDINLNNKYKINLELEANIFNGFIVLSSTVIDKNIDDEDGSDSNRFSIFMIFGYANGTDEEFNISEYFMDDYINSTKNIISKLTENVIIENNIFGFIYLKDQIKSSLIPEEILFYNKSNELIKLTNGSILDKDYILKQNDSLIKNNKNYSLDYQIIITEPEYEIFNLNAKDIINCSSSDLSFEDQLKFYNPKIYFGRTNTLYFKLCHNYCNTCYKYGISDDIQQCMSCLSEYQFDIFNIFPSNCVPENYFNDRENNILELCTENNSKFYINTTNKKRICFKYDYKCPDEYPYFNISTKECLNLTLITTIPTTIDSTITSILPTSILTTSIQTTTFPDILSSISNIIKTNDYNNTDIEFDLNKLNITKEELLYKLKDIIEEIKIGENYKIYGIDFELVIKPTNSNFLENSTHVNFKKCENILREKLNISETRIITFLQLEIYNTNNQF